MALNKKQRLVWSFVGQNDKRNDEESLLHVDEKVKWLGYDHRKRKFL